MSHSMNLVRRPLRHIVYSLLGVLLGGLLLATMPLGDAAERQLAPARVFIDMEGQLAGWAHSVSGGGHTSTTSIKNVTGLGVDDLVVHFGVDMAPIWWKWVSESLGANPVRTHDMAVVRTDIEGRQMDRVVLRQARIKQVHFPIADASAKEAAYFMVIITAASSQYEKLGGQAGPPLSKVRPLLGGAFQFELDGLPTDRVFKVALPVVSIKFTEVRVGTSRTSTSSMPTVSVGNMTVALPVAGDGQAYIDWADDVVTARMSQQNKLQSSLSFLTPNLKEVLMTIHFDQVGFARLILTQPDANAQIIHTMQVELIVEQVRVEMVK